MYIKKIIISVICICVVLGSSFWVNAATVSSEYDISDINVPFEMTAVNAAIGQQLDIKAKSAFLIEPFSGTVLYEDNADEVLPPASITKIMALVLIMEAIDRGDLTLETVISASAHACSMGGSQIWLEPGESMTVDDLLKAVVIASANDATVALGEAIAGSEEGFVALMNSRAKELGMTNTNFINCTGLDSEGHVSTARDVGIMSCELIKHTLIKNYSTVWMDTLRGGESELVNTNKLVRFYEGTTGLKTGTTSGAGYCLSATAMRDGMELVAVIMGGDTSDDRFSGAKKLLDYGFANYSYCEIKPKLPKNFKVKINKGTEAEVYAQALGSLDILSLKTDKAEITQKTVLSKNLTAPIKKGDVIGHINVYKGDEHIGVIDITAKKSIDRLTYGVTLLRMLKGLFTL